jgi:hypothetical protein
MEYRPIGAIHTPFESPEGMPIQPAGAAGVSGTGGDRVIQTEDDYCRDVFNWDLGIVEIIMFDK